MVTGLSPDPDAVCSVRLPVCELSASAGQKETGEQPRPSLTRFDKLQPLCKRDSISLRAISKNYFNNVTSEMSALANYVYANC